MSAADKVDYYDIEVTDEMVDNQVKAYTQRNGKYDKVDVYADNDMLKGLLAELDEQGNTKEGGIQIEGAVMIRLGRQSCRVGFAAEDRQGSCCRSEIQLQLSGRGNHPFRPR